MADGIENDGQPSFVDSVDVYLRQLECGNADAARKLWERYYHRLVRLARKKLGDTSRRTMDEDDVVQSAFSNFCLRARAGSFPNLHDRDSLWALLAVMTAREASKQRLHQHRAKRGGGRIPKQAVADDSWADWSLAQVVARQPSAEDGALFVDRLQRFMDSLDDPSDRLILLWRLEDRTSAEIARNLDCSLSTVERRLRFIRKCLTREISDG